MSDDFRPLAHPFRIPGPLALIIVLLSDLHGKHFLLPWLAFFYRHPSGISKLSTGTVGSISNNGGAEFGLG